MSLLRVALAAALLLGPGSAGAATRPAQAPRGPIRSLSARPAASAASMARPRLWTPAQPAAPRPVSAMAAAQSLSEKGGQAPRASSAEQLSDIGREFDEGSTEPGSATEGKPEKIIEDIRFSRSATRPLRSGRIYGTARLIRNPGSAKYWGKYKKGTLIRLAMGHHTLAVSKITDAKTKRVDQMTLKDFQGLLESKDIEKAMIQRRGRPRRISLSLLRRQFLGALSAFHRHELIHGGSLVRVIHFLPFRQALTLPENGFLEDPEIWYKPRPRGEVAIPEGLKRLHKVLPKVVLLDLRLFNGPMSLDWIEDMDKLMKAGVHIVLISEKPVQGPGSIEEVLTGGLGPRHKDRFARYKLVSLGENGNSLAQYQGSFPSFLPSPRFSPEHIELMEYLAQAEGLELLEKGGGRFSVAVLAGEDAAAAAERLAGRLRSHGGPVQYDLKVEPRGRGNALILRPTGLMGAIPHLLGVMRDELDVFVHPSDMMIISGDAQLKEALPGAIWTQDHAPALGGDSLIEMSLAALLGPYRINKSRDVVGSASMLNSFMNKKDWGEGVSVDQLMGTSVHVAFNWALWVYRAAGALPPVEEVIEKAKRRWEREQERKDISISMMPGADAGGYRDVMIDRLRSMYASIGRLLAEFPIVQGTELPNLHVFDWYRRGNWDHRDIARIIHDLVVAQEIPGGIKQKIVDLKAGQTPTRKGNGQKLQVQLYDLVAQEISEAPIPHKSDGEWRRVMENSIALLTPAGMQEPTLHDWSRAKFKRYLRNKFNAVRCEWFQGKDELKAAAKGAAVAGAAANFPAGELRLPRKVPGLKIKAKYVRMIVSGRKKTEFRTMPATPQPYIAIIQTFTDEEPGRPAEVVAFARLEKVTGSRESGFAWHLTHITPVKPYAAPPRPGAITWLRDVPVTGAKRLGKAP
ncbi:MAG: hypothetical protein HY549_03785 [Elusimicrobia bacterium]|nr:hypothetical protein [Elusimicrobiota bacterium]